MTPQLLTVFNFFVLFFAGSIYIAMPYLTRRTESFGISITEDIYHSAQMKGIRRQYAKMASITVLVILSGTLFLFMQAGEQGKLYVYLGGFFLMLTALFLLYLRFHFLVKKLKEREQWTQGKKQLTIIDTQFRNRRLTHSNLFFLIPFVIILFSAWFTWTNYDRIPDILVMQYDFQGNPSTFRDKSPLAVFWPNLMQLAMLGLFIFVNYIISHAKQQVNPANPEDSLQRNEIFRRKWSAFTIASGTLMVLLFSFTQLTFIFPVPPAVSIGVMMGFTLIILTWALYLSFRVGQGGSRIRTVVDSQGNTIDRDLDQYWKLGQFYYNPDDPAVFLEKRFGIGWSINFGNPKGWLYLAGLVIFIILVSRIGS